MLSALLGLIPAPLLAVLKGLPWRLIGYVALASAIALCAWRVLAWRDAYKRLDAVEAALTTEQHCKAGSSCARRLEELQATGSAAVEDALRAAQEAAGREQAKRDAEARAEAERLTAAASEARGKADAWRRRYETSLKTPACAAWSTSEVPCAISSE